MVFCILPPRCCRTVGAFLLSAEIVNAAEISFPLLNNFVAACFDDAHDIPQCALRNVRIVVAEVALPGPGYPYLCGVAGWCALSHMNVYGFERLVFV